MSETRHTVVVGIDVGGTKTNATVVDLTGTFLVDRMAEVPSLVSDGPDAALDAIVTAMKVALDAGGVPDAAVLAVGLDTPGPASATGVISSKGSTNFQQPAWRGYDIRSATESRLGSAGALQQRRQRRRAVCPRAPLRCRHATPLVGRRHRRHGTRRWGRRARPYRARGIGNGRRVRPRADPDGRPARARPTRAAVQLRSRRRPRVDRLAERNRAQPAAVLARAATPITRSPSWPPGRRARRPARCAAMAKDGDELALRIFAQQAMAIGRMFTIASNYTDPDAYFVGGGVVESAPHFRDWFLDGVRTATVLCARSNGRSPGSPSSPISTWPAPGARRSPPFGQFDPNCRNCGVRMRCR